MRRTINDTTVTKAPPLFPTTHRPFKKQYVQYDSTGRSDSDSIHHKIQILTATNYYTFLAPPLPHNNYCTMSHPKLEQAVQKVDEFLAAYPTLCQYGECVID